MPMKYTLHNILLVARLWLADIKQGFYLTAWKDHGVFIRKVHMH